MEEGSPGKNLSCNCNGMYKPQTISHESQYTEAPQYIQRSFVSSPSEKNALPELLKLVGHGKESENYLGLRWNSNSYRR